jgi:hypothetical protein
MYNDYIPKTKGQSMTTHSHMLKVSQDQALTNSQKLTELFGANDGVVACNAGQTYIICLAGEFFEADLGAKDNSGVYQLIPFNDYDKEVMDGFWDSLLATDDAPLFFYHGAFTDSALEHEFLHSFPE